MLLKRTAAALAAAFLLALAAPAAAALKSPDTVKTALRLLVQVSNDMKRQIENKNLARVPHEDMEFVEAADGLRMAVTDEPMAFKTDVEAKLDTAVKAAADTSALSGKTTDDAALMASHGKVVTAMSLLFDLFPPDLRPDPNAAPPGRRNAAPDVSAKPAPATAPKDIDPYDVLPPNE